MTKIFKFFNAIFFYVYCLRRLPKTEGAIAIIILHGKERNQRHNFQYCAKIWQQSKNFLSNIFLIKFINNIALKNNKKKNSTHSHTPLACILHMKKGKKLHYFNMNN